jgi:hypothetical protein
MYVGRDFDPADPGESQVFGFDWVNDLAVGDSIVGVLANISVQSGTDASPSSRLVSTPFILSPTQAVQRVANVLPGVNYTLQLIATTAQGDTLSLFSHIPGGTVY